MMGNLHGHEHLDKTKLGHAHLQKGTCFNLNANLTLFVNGLAAPTSALSCFFSEPALAGRKDSELTVISKQDNRRVRS